MGMPSRTGYFLRVAGSVEYNQSPTCTRGAWEIGQTMIFINSSSTRFDGVVVSETMVLPHRPGELAGQNIVPPDCGAARSKILPTLNIVKNGICLDFAWDAPTGTLHIGIMEVRR